MEIAYVNYGFQSGVTDQVSRVLEDRGHRVTRLDVIGPLEYREPGTRRLRFTPEIAIHLALAALRFGRLGPYHRWNTGYAFDLHSRNAGRLIAALPRRPDIVLQAGALFAPGLPPVSPYVLLLDNTRALAMGRPAEPSVGLGAPPDYGQGWTRRERALYLGASAIGAFSERVVRSLEEDYGLPAGRARVVGAGANVFPDEVERRDDGETILFVGTRWEIKGGPVLLRAFERIRRRRPRARLLVVGPTGPLALPDGATHLGYLPAERLPSLFSESTVFVLPTLREAFGIAFLDAMACGLPCIGARVEAVPEIVENERTGLLVPPGDDAALASAIERLLDDRALALELGNRGRAKVERSYRWSQVGERLEALLADAARRSREEDSSRPRVSMRP
ncbi:glycosyltransferase family 4 protein [Vulgatibacter incomptus]|uniref:Glycosyl transferase group 1 n=1 Tax=Vulgatibacter incomptus TaxID=1391653 RepID=A0A0K1PBY4_9BACT|nr:glycosyltransferase family 4 protein [Vulgatibacter incomptus]AKU91048.1 glycosyl transferase group 1 [Vulgatibacter incomptus]